jgi:hypothetical protein
MPSATSSNFFANKEMSKLLKGEDYTPPTKIWVGLFTTAPNLDNTGGVEVSTSGTGYKRVPIEQGTGWTGPTGTAQTWSNTQDLVFPTPTGNWGSVRSIALYTAETDGDLLFVGYLTTAKSVSATDNAPIIHANQLRISRATC